LARLAASGIACPRKASAVPVWAGEETVLLPDAPWKIGIQREALIKLALDSQGRVAAKAYFLFQARHVLF